MAKDEKVHDGWSLSSGLPEAFTGKIQDAYFCYDDDYQDGEAALLKLEVMTDDPELGESGLLTLLYPVGKGWEPKSKGAAIEHESDKAKNYNRSSGVGLLVAAGLEVMGDDLRARGTGFEAGVWKGLAFDFERKEYEATIGGEKVNYNRMLPVAVAEGGDDAPKKAAGTTKKAASKSAAKEEATDDEAGDAGGDVEEVKLPAKLRIALKKLAKECDSHDAFVERAFEEIEGVDGDDVAEAAVMDQSDAGIWAQEQG